MSAGLREHPKQWVVHTTGRVGGDAKKGDFAVSQCALAPSFFLTIGGFVVCPLVVRYTRPPIVSVPPFFLYPPETNARTR